MTLIPALLQVINHTNRSLQSWAFIFIPLLALWNCESCFTWLFHHIFTWCCYKSSYNPHHIKYHDGKREQNIKIESKDKISISFVRSWPQYTIYQYNIYGHDIRRSKYKKRLFGAVVTLFLTKLLYLLELMYSKSTVPISCAFLWAIFKTRILRIWHGLYGCDRLGGLADWRRILRIRKDSAELANSTDLADSTDSLGYL